MRCRDRNENLKRKKNSLLLGVLLDRKTVRSSLRIARSNLVPRSNAAEIVLTDEVFYLLNSFHRSRPQSRRGDGDEGTLSPTKGQRYVHLRKVVSGVWTSPLQIGQHKLFVSPIPVPDTPVSGLILGPGQILPGTLLPVPSTGTTISLVFQTSLHTPSSETDPPVTVPPPSRPSSFWSVLLRNHYPPSHRHGSYLCSFPKSSMNRPHTDRDSCLRTSTTSPCFSRPRTEDRTRKTDTPVTVTDKISTSH